MISARCLLDVLRNVVQYSLSQVKPRVVENTRRCWKLEAGCVFKSGFKIDLKNFEIAVGDSLIFVVCSEA